MDFNAPVARQHWEGSVQRSWESLREDASGRLLDSNQGRIAARRGSAESVVAGAIRRGLIRYVMVVVDMSDSMAMSDFRPSRGAVASEVLEQWLSDFFAENPLSQVGLIAMRGGRAEKLTDLSANKRAHVNALAQGGLAGGGEASLQNALELAAGLLRDIPEYGHREVVVLFGSLATKDPGDIFQTMDKCRRLRMHVSVVGLCAEVYILRAVADDTGGTCSVATDAEHLRLLLAALLVPPPTGCRESLLAEMMEMGFPKRDQGVAAPLMAYDGGSTLKPVTMAYTCPRCASRTTEIPSVCVVCTLPLVSSPHLTQSYHHLFPLAAFEPSPAAASPAACAGCGSTRGLAADDGWFQCPGCTHGFCIECDSFLHDSLHNCPGCLDLGV